MARDRANSKDSIPMENSPLRRNFKKMEKGKNITTSGKSNGNLVKFSKL